MAKFLHYRRHSTKDGTTKDTVGPKGFALAVAEGNKLGLETKFGRVFHGVLVRTAQTALAFCHGMGYAPQVMPVVEEIGDDALFSQIATPAFREAAKAGASNFQATLATHGKVKARKWAEMALAGVAKMFEAMTDGETAIAFGHSPVIELAAWAARGFAELPEGLRRLSDLEGIQFATDDAGRIVFCNDKIAVG